MAETERSVGELLDQLQQDIQDEDFQAGRGTSNEENIHIYGYDPRDEMTVRCFVARLERNKALHCRLKSYNLYQVFLEMLQAKPKVCERIPQLEARKGSRFLLEKLAGMITPQAFAEHMAYAAGGHSAGLFGRACRRAVSGRLHGAGAQAVQSPARQRVLPGIQYQLNQLLPV